MWMKAKVEDVIMEMRQQFTLGLQRIDEREKSGSRSCQGTCEEMCPIQERYLYDKRPHTCHLLCDIVF
jgi:hypothetical protein